MNRVRRNFKHAKIRSEDLSRDIQAVGPNSYVSLFDAGYKAVVLFDFKTDIHFAMHDVFLPGLKDVKREFIRAYAEILLRRCGDKITFAQIDYDHEQANNVCQGNKAAYTRQQLSALSKRLEQQNSCEKLGSIRIIDSDNDDVVSFDLKGDKVPKASDKTIAVGWQGGPLINPHSPMYSKVRLVSGPSKHDILSAIHHNGVCSIPARSEVDFSLRDCPIRPPNP